MPPFVLPNCRVASRSAVWTVSDPRLFVDEIDRKRMPKIKSTRPALSLLPFPSTRLLKSLYLSYFALRFAG